MNPTHFHSEVHQPNAPPWAVEYTQSQKGLPEQFCVAAACILAVLRRRWTSSADGGISFQTSTIPGIKGSDSISSFFLKRQDFQLE
ncbi:MAG: hypothetical protein PHE53_00060 [Thermoguttaceae bacterium]|nr:hypothetical protein [Thermoguttaceae bacterium]